MKYVSRDKTKGNGNIFYRYICMFLIVFMIFEMFSINQSAFADEVQEEKKVVLNPGEFFGYIKYGEGMYSYPVYIWDGTKEQVAYCFNAHKAWPHPAENLKYGMYSLYKEEHYTLPGNESIMRTIYNGYPYNKAGLQEKFELSDMELRAVTQAAVWKYTDGLNMSEAKIKITQKGTLDWNDNMSRAYEKLTGNGSELISPPEDFTLKLYTTTNDYEGYPVQQLLSTEISTDAKPEPMPIYSTTASLEAEKVMDGSVPSEEQVFNFELLNENGEVIDTASNNGGRINFKPITYTSVGIYKYFIKELAGKDSEVIYDPTVYEVQVEVTNNGSGVLSSKVSYYEDGSEVNYPVFENKTKVHEYDLRISKTVTGVYGDKDRMFDFEIILKDKDGNNISGTFDIEMSSIDGNDNPEMNKLSFINGDASISLKDGQAITVSGIPEGSSYTVKEVDADDYDTTINGAASDNKTVFGADIHDDVKLEFINNRDDMNFENIPVIFEVEKLIETEGGKPSKEEEFTFVLSADDESYPMPDINTISIIGEGKTSFDEISYTKPGIYTYTVTERSENIAGYTFDETIYHVIVSVIAEKDGDVFRLSPTVVAIKNGSDENTDIIFVNRYSEPENPVPDTEDSKPQPEPENPTPDIEELKPQPEPENPAPDTEDSKPVQIPLPEGEGQKPNLEPTEQEPVSDVIPENTKDDKEDTLEEVVDDKSNTVIEDSEKAEYYTLPQTGNIWSDEIIILSGLMLLMVGMYIIKETKHE